MTKEKLIGEIFQSNNWGPVEVLGFDDTKKRKKYKVNLDKDKLQVGLPRSKKVYSKDTCCWLTREENMQHRGEAQ